MKKRDRKTSYVQDYALVHTICADINRTNRHFKTDSEVYIYIQEEFKKRRMEWNADNDRMTSRAREPWRKPDISVDSIMRYLGNKKR